MKLFFLTKTFFDGDNNNNISLKKNMKNINNKTTKEKEKTFDVQCFNFTFKPVKNETIPNKWVVWITKKEGSDLEKERKREIMPMNEKKKREKKFIFLLIFFPIFIFFFLYYIISFLKTTIMCCCNWIDNLTIWWDSCNSLFFLFVLFHLFS